MFRGSVGFRVLEVFVVLFLPFKVIHFVRPGSTVHCIYGFSPPIKPGQNPGQKPDKKSG